MRWVLLAAAFLASGSCLLTRTELPLRRICFDGLPLKILQDAKCPDGICGYTCAPNRWTNESSTEGQ